MTLSILTQFIRHTYKKHLQALHESIYITAPQLTHEFYNIKTGLCIRHFCIIGDQEIQKAITNLVIRKSQSIKTDLFIISFDCEITTLINHRKRVSYLRTIFRKSRCLYFYSINQQAQIIITLFQQVNEIGRCTRLKPIIIKLITIKNI